MSLWNQSADTIKCPGCADNLLYEAKIGKLVCRSCGNMYVPESLDYSGRLEIRDTKEAGEENSHQQEIICDSCGASIVTDETTAASFCSFCGSPALSRRRLALEFKPDFIIPFTVEREEAEKIFLEWAGSHKTVPRKFTSPENVKKLTGMYVPFWLIDSTVDCTIEGSGYLTTPGNPMAMLFAVDRDIEFKLKRVPFDGAKKISNRLMRSIEPFDYDEMVPFNPNYIPGYFAQRYDMKAIDMLDYISNRFAKYGGELGKYYEPNTENRYSKLKISKVIAEAGDFKQSYALLPVWFLRYKQDGRNYDFVINGQTGEPGGDLPYSPIKRRLAIMWAYFSCYGLMALIVLAAFAFTVYTLFGTLRYATNAIIGTLMLAAVYCGAALGLKALSGLRTKVRDKIFAIKNDTLNLIDEAPDALQYYDTAAGIILKDHRDTYVSNVSINEVDFGNDKVETYVRRAVANNSIENSLRRISRRPFL